MLMMIKNSLECFVAYCVDSLLITDGYVLSVPVSELLQEYRGEVGGSAESDLRSLCVALVDALSQRSRALRTQRSANR